MFTHSLDQLSSGITVIRIPMPASVSVTVLALANTGSRYETADQQGIAHFFEHMVFKGTAAYPTAQDLATTVDSVGANFNAFTSKEYTGYYVQAGSQHFPVALDVVSDMLMTPQLRQEDIDREKGVIVEEINMYVDNPSAHVSNVFGQMVFAGSGLEHDIIGSKETVTSFISQDFKDFLATWYGLSNLVLVVAGDAKVVGQEALLEQIDHAFSKPAGQRASQRANLDTHLDAHQLPKSGQLQLIHRETEQTHFVLAYPGISRHDDRRYVAAVLDALLGGNMSSRLFSEVREKRGLCYYVHSDSDNYHDTGLFGAAAGVDPQRIDEALEVTIGEFAALVDGSKPVTDEEVQRVKDYVTGKLTLGLESSRSVASFLGMKYVLTQKIETPEEVLKKISAVTTQEVQQLAEQLVQPANLNLAILGPYQDQAKFEKFV